MTQQEIVPVVLAGGSGTRLWPLSRKSYPKQFAPLLGEETLFRAAVRRLSGATEALRFDRPLILTAPDFRFVVMEQLGLDGVQPEAVMIEPAARNTAPAILAAALYLVEKKGDAIMLVTPSDQVMPDSAAFHAAVGRGLEAVRKGNIVTFGIQPTHAETGYGYLELTEKPDAALSPVALARFVEKPDAERAAVMLAQGNFLWNAGIFLFSAKDLVAAFEALAPDFLEPVRAAVAHAQQDLDFLRLSPEKWDDVEDRSIDYAIMERASNLSVVPYDAGWSDLGGWDAVWKHSHPDEHGVAVSGEATALDCRNTLLRSDSEGLALVGLGLENIVAVAMNDAVLIADKSRTQDVKRVVDVLKGKGLAQATRFPKDHRPWGWYESLAVGSRFQVKRIMVKPGASLSLQSHFHRAEHWIVVEGTAQVRVDDSVQTLSENQSVYIPLGAVHRIENPGKIPLVFIEVQTGAYLGEDDIVRYEDRYARG